MRAIVMLLNWPVDSLRPLPSSLFMVHNSIWTVQKIVGTDLTHSDKILIGKKVLQTLVFTYVELLLLWVTRLWIQIQSAQFVYFRLGFVFGVYMSLSFHPVSARNVY